MRTAEHKRREVIAPSGYGLVCEQQMYNHQIVTREIVSTKASTYEKWSHAHCGNLHERS